MEKGSSSNHEEAEDGFGYGYLTEVYLMEQGQRAQSPSLARHALTTFEAADKRIKVGYFYEIDHSKLLPKAPEQLFSIKVVMVSDKTPSETSLRFPSVHSLRSHFDDGNHGKPEGKKLPAFDEKYVMGSGMAAEVLFRSIPAHEVAKGGDLWSFWASPTTAPKINCISEAISKKGSCWSELKFNSGMVQWGQRRHVRFLNRHEEYKLGVLASSANEDDDHNEAKKEEDKRGCDEEEDEEDEEQVEEGVEEDNVKEEADDEINGLMNRRSSKRKIRTKNSKNQNLKRARSEQKQSQKVHNRNKKKKPLKNSIERWSAARYKLAEENMLKIMKAKGAIFGNPILRPALRSEARKLIGDTGLLDHLLKHMAGKVAPGGSYRFRRRHNSDGAMEYWIENAELVNIRRQAGVQDPYWMPPPGWKPGDNPTQDPVCAREIESIKEDNIRIKKNIEELVLKLQEERQFSQKEVKQLIREEMGKIMKKEEASPNSESSPTVQYDHGDYVVLMKKMYMELVNKKAKIEEQLVEISKCLGEMEAQIGMFKPGHQTLSESEATPPLLMAPPSSSEAFWERKDQGSQSSTSVTKSGENEKGDKPAADDKATRMQRLKSGFRICKPQGTFLWPNMVTSSSQADHVVHTDDHDNGPVVVRTPPSVSSSATSEALPHNHLVQVPQTQYHCGPKPPSPVKPLAEKLPIRPATLSTVSKISSSTSLPPPPKTPNSQTIITLKTSTSLINLNESPADQTNDAGFCGSLTYQRRISNVTSVSTMRNLVPTEKGIREGAEDKENGTSYFEFAQQQQRESSSTGTSRVPQTVEDQWLALASKDPALSNSKRI